MRDWRFIAEYDNDRHVLPVMTRAFTPAELAPFVGQEILVTFTAKVPLEAVARASDCGLARFIESTVLQGRATMASPEYRAVGATFSDFGQQYAGLVHLQVTCQLRSPDVPTGD